MRAVAFSPDGGRIVSAGNNRTLRVWDTQTGRERRTLRGHTGWVACAAFSPDGRAILSGGHDGTVRLWDAAAGTQLMTLRGHAGPVASLSVSPDGGRIISAGWDRTVRLWDTTSGCTAALAAASVPQQPIQVTQDVTVCHVEAPGVGLARLWCLTKAASRRRRVPKPCPATRKIHNRVRPVLASKPWHIKTHLSSCTGDRSLRARTSSAAK